MAIYRCILRLVVVAAIVLVNAFPVSAEFYPLGFDPVSGTYIGTLPCDDCAGIWAELTVTDNSISGYGPGTFVMNERFTGGMHGGQEMTVHGTWATTKMPDSQLFTSTIELRGVDPSGRSKPPLSFDCFHGRLLMLNVDRPELQASFRGITQAFLWRVIASPKPYFGPLTERDGDSTIVGRLGDVFEIDLPALSRQTEEQDWIIRQVPGHLVIDRSGSSDSSRTATVFRVKAVSVGEDRVVIENTTDPSRKVVFSFEIVR